MDIFLIEETFTAQTVLTVMDAVVGGEYNNGVLRKRTSSFMSRDATSVWYYDVYVLYSGSKDKI